MLARERRPAQGIANGSDAHDPVRHPDGPAGADRPLHRAPRRHPQRRPHLRDKGLKGTITGGKLANLVILNANPLTVAPEKIRDIKVVETIKRGRTIYRKG